MRINGAVEGVRCVKHGETIRMERRLHWTTMLTYVCTVCERETYLAAFEKREG